MKEEEEEEETMMISRCKWSLYGEGYGISGVMYIRNERICWIQVAG